MAELGKPVWLHPARGAEMPDYRERDEVALRNLVGAWAGPTRPAAPWRGSSSPSSSTYPNLKILVHHFGGIVPMLEGRIGTGWDLLGTRTTDVDYVALRKSLKKRPLDYFKQDFYADTAAFGACGDHCGLDFYPDRQVVFASDCPFDPEKGPGYIRETLENSRQPRHPEGRARGDRPRHFRADHRRQAGEVAAAPARMADVRLVRR